MPTLQTSPEQAFREQLVDDLELPDINECTRPLAVWQREPNVAGDSTRTETPYANETRPPISIEQEREESERGDSRPKGDGDWRGAHARSDHHHPNEHDQEERPRKCPWASGTHLDLPIRRHDAHPLR